MARIHLVTRPAFGVRYQHANERAGVTTLIQTYHLTIRLYVAPRDSGPRWRPVPPTKSARPFVAVLDTGSPLTIIPHNVWQGFADDVHILAQPEPDAEMQVAGGSHNGQLGRVRLGALDDAENWMPAEWTVAIFLDPPSPGRAAALTVPLLGLNSHLLSHRRRLQHIGSYEGDDHATVPKWRLEDRFRLLPW